MFMHEEVMTTPHLIFENHHYKVTKCGFHNFVFIRQIHLTKSLKMIVLSFRKQFHGKKHDLKWITTKEKVGCGLILNIKRNGIQKARKNKQHDKPFYYIIRIFLNIFKGFKDSLKIP